MGPGDPFVCRSKSKFRDFRIALDLIDRSKQIFRIDAIDDSWCFFCSSHCPLPFLIKIGFSTFRPILMPEPVFDGSPSLITDSNNLPPSLISLFRHAL
jgi:hypothetical protein